MDGCCWLLAIHLCLDRYSWNAPTLLSLQLDSIAAILYLHLSLIFMVVVVLMVKLQQWLFSLPAKMREFGCLGDCSFRYCWAPGPRNVSQVLSVCGGSPKATLGHVQFWCPQNEPKPVAVVTSVPMLINEVLLTQDKDKLQGHFTHNTTWCTTLCPFTSNEEVSEKKNLCIFSLCDTSVLQYSCNVNVCCSAISFILNLFVCLW